MDSYDQILLVACKSSWLIHVQRDRALGYQRQKGLVPHLSVASKLDDADSGGSIFKEGSAADFLFIFSKQKL